MKRIFILLTLLVGCYMIIGANDRVIEQTNKVSEVSEERINNTIMWRNDIYENEYKNKI